ncbi:hypothetical protein U5801_26360 [Lamprobacter modestohalophilus]|uniref:Uncharacterized protein n=1 Tax=Lamprobacter modestohalophilus TaxID=1064514 RepID=A0A9X1B783_9GAMM|nr:hypothetical protein [Lamprobacter modestohalophilus]MBK1621631.1 hypothetical protein [Lamprobacter modestohalophilus]MEA1053299.1 hypothetical protein [Lamprobacter modestohalophilus]
MEKTKYWLLMMMAAASLVLVVANIIILNGNRNLQVQVSERNLYIQQSLQLEGIYQPLLKTLAELSVQHNDVALRELLASQGIGVQVNAPTSSASGPGNVSQPIIDEEETRP